VSIVDKWRSLDSSNRFLIAYPVWFLALFGVFYWGKFWSLSPIGEYLDHLQRSMIMGFLDAVLNNQIINYDIVINSHYRVVITPECNGFVPYFIYLAGVLAYPKSWQKKLIWAIVGYIVFSVVNLIRLYLVTIAVNSFGADIFFWAHDVGGNLLLVVTGAWMFLKYLDS